MIKGLAITPPVLGRISIGQTIERNGKRLPSKDDQFTITSQIQTKEGWIPHPLDEELRKHSANGKLRSIPVSVLSTHCSTGVLDVPYALVMVRLADVIRNRVYRRFRAQHPMVVS